MTGASAQFELHQIRCFVAVADTPMPAVLLMSWMTALMSAAACRSMSVPLTIK